MSKSFPSLAVVLPTRNRAGMLKNVLGNLSNQSFTNFVVRVSDNGSTDGTLELKASDFPDLNIIWKRRAPSLPGLAEHYQQIISECEEDFIAIAHDDEIYSKDWLAVLMEGACGGATLAFGRALNIDARGDRKTAHFRSPYLAQGWYQASELKAMVSLGRGQLCGNGFLLRRKEAQRNAAILTDYEQYDFEWMMRVASAGLTFVSDRYLNTHMVHKTNTLGSREYLFELANRIHACTMIQQWLRESDALSPDRNRRHLELDRARIRGLTAALFSSMQRNEATLPHILLTRLLEEKSLTHAEAVLLREINRPIFFPILRFLAHCRLKIKARVRRRWPNEVSLPALIQAFPEVAGYCS